MYWNISIHMSNNVSTFFPLSFWPSESIPATCMLGFFHAPQKPNRLSSETQQWLIGNLVWQARLNPSTRFMSPHSHPIIACIWLQKTFSIRYDTEFDPVEDSRRQNGLTHKEAIRGKEIQTNEKDKCTCSTAWSAAPWPPTPAPIITKS